MTDDVYWLNGLPFLVDGELGDTYWLNGLPLLAGTEAAIDGLAPGPTAGS